MTLLNLLFSPLLPQPPISGVEDTRECSQSFYNSLLYILFISFGTKVRVCLLILHWETVKGSKSYI